MPKLPQVIEAGKLSADLIKVSNVCVAASASYRLCKPAQTARLIIKHAQCNME